MSDAGDTSLAYQELQPDDIIASVESLDFRSDGRLLPLNSYENRVYRVGQEDKPPLVAKFYRPGRWTDDAILEEHAFALELAAEEIPVVPPIQHDGKTLHFHDQFRFSVYPCHGGRSPDLDNLDLLQDLGRFVGRIHLLGEQHDFEHRAYLSIETHGIASRDYLLRAGFMPESLVPAYESICEDLFAGVNACIDRAGEIAMIRLHGDFHPGNVLVTESGVHIVDLDDTLMGPAAQDLWMFLSGDRAEQTPQLEELLEGYVEFRDFDARELHLIEALRSLRIMHYAAWLARRWEDPAFKTAFPWFNSHRYWDEHILSLKEQVSLMCEPPLSWMGGY